jgi:diaminopimelate epimerase
MGAPVFDLSQVPFNAAGLQSRPCGTDMLWPLHLPQAERWFSVLSMGNPHAVQLVDALTDEQVHAEGPLIERHERFVARVNAGFMQHLGGDAIALRVWERGVGETLACGSGACAAAVAALRRGLVRSPVSVHMRGGLLTIAWEGAQVLMTGPAETVFSGEIEL